MAKDIWSMSSQSRSMLNPIHCFSILIIFTIPCTLTIMHHWSRVFWIISWFFTRHCIYLYSVFYYNTRVFHCITKGRNIIKYFRTVGHLLAVMATSKFTWITIKPYLCSGSLVCGHFSKKSSTVTSFAPHQLKL